MIRHWSADPLRTPSYRSGPGNERYSRWLFDTGASVKTVTDTGKPMLHCAATSGNEAIVQLLLNQGVNIEAKDQYGQTALHSVAWNGNQNIVRLLLDRAANLEVAGRDGEIALHAAAWGGYEAIVEFLLDRGSQSRSKAQRWKDDTGICILECKQSYNAAATKDNEGFGGLLFQDQHSCCRSLLLAALYL
jgi:ankyrin repeat protein